MTIIFPLEIGLNSWRKNSLRRFKFILSPQFFDIRFFSNFFESIFSFFRFFFSWTDFLSRRRYVWTPNLGLTRFWLFFLTGTKVFTMIEGKKDHSSNNLFKVTSSSNYCIGLSNFLPFKAMPFTDHFLSNWTGITVISLTFNY